MPKVKKASVSADIIAAILKTNESSYAFYNRYRTELNMSWSSYRRCITGEPVSEEMISRILTVASQAGVYRQAQRSVDVAYLRELHRLHKCIEENDDPDKAIELISLVRAYWRKNQLPIQIALERLERKDPYDEPKEN